MLRIDIKEKCNYDDFASKWSLGPCQQLSVLVFRYDEYGESNSTFSKGSPENLGEMRMLSIDKNLIFILNFTYA